MNAKEEKVTEDFKKENPLSIIVPVFFSKKAKRENILLDVVNWVVLLNNYKHDKRNSFKTCLLPDIKMRAHVFICFNNFIGSGPTAVNFVNIPFSIQKCRFLLLNPWLNAGGPLEICKILRESI